MEWRLLADIPPDEVRLLLSIARRRRFSRGEVVFHRDDPGNALHLIVAGHFTVRVATPTGRTVMIALRGPGEHFGELALVAEDSHRSATVAALEPADTLAVFHEDFDRLRRVHPSVDRVLVVLLAAELRAMSDRLVEALNAPVEKRILRRLVELARVYARDGAYTIPLTQEELAEFAGTSRAAVNRVLRTAELEGTLELRRRQTVILDLQRLEAQAR